MRLAVLGSIALALVLPAAFSARVVSADDDAVPAGLTEAEAKCLERKLRSRASDWWRHRKRLAMVCPQCKGRGQVRWRKGRRRVLVDCPKCDGNKLYVDKDMYRYCFYDRRSPAFRIQEGIRARVSQEYVNARSGQPFPVILKRYAIKDVELVDATHGIVHVERNKDSVARPQQWIWAEARGKSDTWYLYDAQADGPWPSGEAALAPTRPAEEEPAEAVPASPTPEPVQPGAPAPPPAVAPRPPKDEPPIDRVTLADGLALVEKWTGERNQLKARAIRIELGLDGVEGHEETVADARTFLGEIEGWLAKEKPVYERAVKDVKERGLGVRLDDRIQVNTSHFKAYRRLDLIEKMLVAIVPGLRD